MGHADGASRTGRPCRIPKFPSKGKFPDCPVKAEFPNFPVRGGGGGGRGAVGRPDDDGRTRTGLGQRAERVERTDRCEGSNRSLKGMVPAKVFKGRRPVNCIFWYGVCYMSPHCDLGVAKKVGDGALYIQVLEKGPLEAYPQRG